MEYQPDKWVIIKITANVTGKIHYRLFASWYGGYIGSDSWKMNSGITHVIKREDGYFEIHGESGSVYTCHENCWGMTGYARGVLTSYQNQSVTLTIDLVPEDADFTAINYVV